MSKPTISVQIENITINVNEGSNHDEIYVDELVEDLYQMICELLNGLMNEGKIKSEGLADLFPQGAEIPSPFGILQAVDVSNLSEEEIQNLKEDFPSILMQSLPEVMKIIQDNQSHSQFTGGQNDLFSSMTPFFEAIKKNAEENKDKPQG